MMYWHLCLLLDLIYGYFKKKMKLDYSLIKFHSLILIFSFLPTFFPPNQIDITVQSRLKLLHSHIAPEGPTTRHAALEFYKTLIFLPPLSKKKSNRRLC